MKRARGFLAGCFTIILPAVATGQQRPADLGKLATTLNLTDQGIAGWLTDLGVTVGDSTVERLLALTPTGERVAEGFGGPSSVHLGAELDILLHRPGRATVLVHNHPKSVGLSGADIGQLAKPGVAAIVAIGHDGSLFMASPGPRMNAQMLEERQYAMATAEVSKRLRAEWPSGRVSVATSDAHFSHVAALALAKAQVIGYWYTLRGDSRSSYETARVIFGQVAEGAATAVRGVN